MLCEYNSLIDQTLQRVMFSSAPFAGVRCTVEPARPRGPGPVVIYLSPHDSRHSVIPFPNSPDQVAHTRCRLHNLFGVKWVRGDCRPARHRRRLRALERNS